MIETKKYLKGKVVAPTAPRKDADLYWGYNVRLAECFGHVFTESPYKDGYDLAIGTSERGTHVDDVELPTFK